MRCFLDDLRAFGINAEQLTTEAQDEGDWRTTMEQGALRHAVVCPNVTARAKDRIAQSKRVRAGSLAIVDYPQVARTFILRACGSQMSCFFSGVPFVLFYIFVSFRFRRYTFIEVAALRSIVLRYACAPKVTHSNCLGPFLYPFYFR